MHDSGVKTARSEQLLAVRNKIRLRILHSLCTTAELEQVLAGCYSVGGQEGKFQVQTGPSAGNSRSSTGPKGQSKTNGCGSGKAVPQCKEGRYGTSTGRMMLGYAVNGGRVEAGSPWHARSRVVWLGCPGLAGNTAVNGLAHPSTVARVTTGTAGSPQ